MLTFSLKKHIIFFKIQLQFSMLSIKNNLKYDFIRNIIDLKKMNPSNKKHTKNNLHYFK